MGSVPYGVRRLNVGRTVACVISVFVMLSPGVCAADVLGDQTRVSRIEVPIRTGATNVIGSAEVQWTTAIPIDGEKRFQFRIEVRNLCRDNLMLATVSLDDWCCVMASPNPRKALIKHRVGARLDSDAVGKFELLRGQADTWPTVGVPGWAVGLLQTHEDIACRAFVLHGLQENAEEYLLSRESALEFHLCGFVLATGAPFWCEVKAPVQFRRADAGTPH